MKYFNFPVYTVDYSLLEVGIDNFIYAMQGFHKVNIMLLF